MRTITAYHAVENHSPNARYAIVEKRDEVWSAQLLKFPDHASAADMALLAWRGDLGNGAAVGAHPGSLSIATDYQWRLNDTRR